MQYRSIATIISSGVIGLTRLAGAPSLQAQARFAVESSPLTERPWVQARSVAMENR